MVGANFNPAVTRNEPFSTERLVDAFSVSPSQLPTGLGITSARQIEFGPEVIHNDFTLDTDGSLTILHDMTINLKFGCQFGREGSNGVSELWFYLTVNDVQAGKSITYDFNRAEDTHYLDYETMVNVVKGAVIKGFVLRATGTHNSGGLYQKLSPDGLNPAPSATLRIDKLT